MTAQNVPPPPKKSFASSLTRWLDNPVFAKELRGQMRDRKAFIVLTLYLFFIASVMALIYYAYKDSANTYAPSPDELQTMGKLLFGTVVLIELTLVSFIAPGLTAGAVTVERERRTFDLLKTTLLTPREFIFGKLSSAVLYLFLLIFTALPIQSVAFLLGGVGLAEMIISTILLIVTAVFFATLGIFFSSFLKRTLAATISAYGSILFSAFVLGFFIFSVGFLGSLASNSNNPVSATLVTLILWIIVSTNPLLAPIFTEVMLIETQSIFFFDTASSFGGPASLYLPSPWILYVLFYSLLTLLLLLLSVHFVRQPER
ncbi:MAG: ABC transporter permease subunit [Anaerolineales bacterium]|nr:ABC transporter permease subunit [Anaerolineales bacterium]